MFHSVIKNISNWRAVFWLIVPLAVQLGQVVPATAAYLTDETSGVTGQMFASAISELEDMNGDGRGEFLLGARADDVNGLDAGAVFYYRSRSTNSHGLQQVWRGVGGEQFGYAVARVGDVNSDGTPDFAVGAPYSDAGGAGSGRVCLFWGGSNISSTPDMVIMGALAGDAFGFAISAAGDFNGDGEDDFIVGAPFKNAPGLDSGAAYVIYGGNGGPSTNLADALLLGGEVAGDQFGTSVTDAGNFLGTNNACVAVGAPFNSAAGIEAGAAYVFEGATFPSNPDAVFDLKLGSGATARTYGHFGFSVRGIDRWDADGYDDLAVGAPDCNEAAASAGRVEVFFGGTSPSTTGDRYANGETATDNLGYALARVGDVVGSGNDDLLMGAPGFDGAALDGGRAYLFPGGSNSTNDAGTLNVLANVPLGGSSQADDKFGFAVASAGLFDADGTLDYAVGAPGGNIGTTAAAGFCWVADSGGSVVGLELPRWQAVWSPAGGVDLRFSLGIDAGQVSSLEISRQEDGGPGQVLWSGTVQASGPMDLGGGLAFDGQDFSFRDTSAASGTLLYALAVTTVGGQSFAQEALAGPQGLPGVSLALDRAWPNPFNPTVSVRLRVPQGQQAECRVTNLRGHRVATLYTGRSDGSWRTVTWNGMTDTGLKASSGVYLITLEAGQRRAVQRVVLAK